MRSFLIRLGVFVTLIFSQVTPILASQDTLNEFSNRGWTDATSLANFAPDRMLNRAELIKWVTLKVGVTELEARTCLNDDRKRNWRFIYFRDVKPADWFAGYVCVAAEKEWLRDQKRLKPSDLVSEREAMQLLWRVLYGGRSNAEDWKAKGWITDKIRVHETVQRGEYAKFLLTKNSNEVEQIKPSIPKKKPSIPSTPVKEASEQPQTTKSLPEDQSVEPEDSSDSSEPESGEKKQESKEQKAKRIIISRTQPGTGGSGGSRRLSGGGGGGPSTPPVTTPTPPAPEPEDPTDPTDPEDPETPEDPTDPTDPEDPETPEDPTDPTDPEDPENPEDPTDPTDPEDPENPEDPTDPTDPEDPEIVFQACHVQPANQQLGQINQNHFWPLSGSTQPDQVGSIFGPRIKTSDGGRYDFHRGIDMNAPTGTEVYAIADGHIQEVVESAEGGTTFKIDHTDQGNYESRYTHLDAVVEEWESGQEIKKGDLIGYVGSTGETTLEHLHFSIKLSQAGDSDSLKMNPFEYLPYNNTANHTITILNKESFDLSNPQLEIEAATPKDELDLNEVKVTVYSADCQVLDTQRVNLNDRINAGTDNDTENNIKIKPLPFTGERNNPHPMQMDFLALTVAEEGVRIVVEAIDLYGNSVFDEVVVQP